MQTIPFYKPCLGADEIAEVVATLQSGWLTTGPKTKQFERDFAEFTQHKHAVALNSCTAALHLALEAIGLKAGQGVIVPTMTFAATAEVVRYFDGRPILVDCRADDFNLDVADAERKVQAALASGLPVAAIMPVHYGGQIGDVAGIQALAHRHRLKIIEDAAHCCPAYYRVPETTKPRNHGERDHGTTDHGLRGQSFSAHCQSFVVSSPSTHWLSVGTGADISCYSFYANKPITTGEGGMACTENDQYADRMRIMSLHGISRDAWQRYTAEGSWYYEIIAPGYKCNLADIASAIGIHQLRKAAQFHRRRTEIARQYTELLGDVEEVILPRIQPHRVHSWHLFVIRLRLDRLQIDRAQFITELHHRGIGTSVHWLPLHLHPYYRETYGYKPRDFPIAASLYPELISLPIYPDLSEADVQYVCDSVTDVIAANRRLHHARPVKVSVGV